MRRRSRRLLPLKQDRPEDQPGLSGGRCPLDSLFRPSRRRFGRGHPDHQPAPNRQRLVIHPCHGLLSLPFHQEGPDPTRTVPAGVEPTEREDGRGLPGRPGDLLGMGDSVREALLVGRHRLPVGLRTRDLSPDDPGLGGYHSPRRPPAREEVPAGQSTRIPRTMWNTA